MYLFLRPNQMLQWSDVSEEIVARVRRDNPDRVLDLERLEWKPFGEWPLDEDTMRMALRHGTPTAKGIVVGFQSIVPLHHYRQMRSILSRDSTDVQHADLMERLMPGWRERTRDLDDRVDASMALTVERAYRDLEQAFEASQPDAALVEHWSGLGGAVPDPL